MIGICLETSYRQICLGIICRCSASILTQETVDKETNVVSNIFALYAEEILMELNNVQINLAVTFVFFGTRNAIQAVTSVLVAENNK